MIIQATFFVLHVKEVTWNCSGTYMKMKNLFWIILMMYMIFGWVEI